MKIKGNNVNHLSAEAARAILRVVPLMMRMVRDEMRTCPACRAGSLSVPQFRTLNYIDRHTAASLSEVAAHIGVTLPSMSRLVEGLVTRKLLIRRGDLGDRRRLTLRLTARGRELLRMAREFTKAAIASKLLSLGGEDLDIVVRAMGVLHPLFAGVHAMVESENP